MTRLPKWVRELTSPPAPTWEPIFHVAPEPAPALEPNARWTHLSGLVAHEPAWRVTLGDGTVRMVP